MDMDLSKLRLAAKISGEGGQASSEPVVLRYGEVTGIDGNTLAVKISGGDAIVPGVPFLTSYAPTVGDVIVLAKSGGDLWALGTFDGEVGSGGGGGGGGGFSFDGGPKNGRGLYTNWTFPALPGGGGFYAYDVIVHVEQAPLPSDPDPGYFWAHQYGFQGAGGAWVGAAYVGLQMTGYGDGNRNQCIWSVWDSPVPSISEFGVVSGSPPGALAVFAHPFGGEGIGQTINLVNCWQNGHTYRMRLYSLGDDGHGDGSQWFRLYFADLGTDPGSSTPVWEVVVGKIRNPDGQGLITPNATSFMEPYGGPKDQPTDWPYASALIRPPVGNPFDLTTYPANAHTSWASWYDSWPGSLVTEASGGAVRHEFGLYSGGGDGSGGGGGGTSAPQLVALVATDGTVVGPENFAVVPFTAVLDAHGLWNNTTQTFDLPGSGMATIQVYGQYGADAVNDAVAGDRIGVEGSFGGCQLRDRQPLIPGYANGAVARGDSELMLTINLTSSGPVTPDAVWDLRSLMSLAWYRQALYVIFTFTPD